jgi:hypothetical protein
MWQRLRSAIINTTLFDNPAAGEQDVEHRYSANQIHGLIGAARADVLA